MSIIVAEKMCNTVLCLSWMSRKCGYARRITNSAFDSVEFKGEMYILHFYTLYALIWKCQIRIYSKRHFLKKQLYTLASPQKSYWIIKLKRNQFLLAIPVQVSEDVVHPRWT